MPFFFTQLEYLKYLKHCCTMRYKENELIIQNAIKKINKKTILMITETKE